MRARPLRLVMAALLGAALSGCSLSATDLPLPGLGVEGESYEVTAVFADALNLPDGAHVKLGGDDIGRVREIRPDRFDARVTMQLRADIRLPEGTTAELRQATPLGEVFVALHPPAGRAAPGGPALKDGDVIDLARTDSAASVEDLLATLSGVVNGGGLAQLPVITHEVNAALAGRAPELNRLINTTRTTVGTLTAHTQDFDRVLDAANRASQTLREGSKTIDEGFRDLPPAVEVFADETDHLVAALNSAGRASRTADHILRESDDEARGLLRAAGPVLDGFTDTRPYLGPSLGSLVYLGRSVEAITKGEGAAAHGVLALGSLILLPPISGPPGPDDLVDGGRDLANVFERQLRTFGGTR